MADLEEELGRIWSLVLELSGKPNHHTRYRYPCSLTQLHLHLDRTMHE